MNKKYYLVYKTTNLVNGKIYIGKHETNNIDDGYLGSGKLLKRAIEKYGEENFKREILFECSTREEMNAKEAELVNEDFLKRKDVYNIKLGGEGGWDYLNNSNSEYAKGTAKRHNAVVKAVRNRNMQKQISRCLETREKWSEEKRKEISKKISDAKKRLYVLDKTLGKRQTEKLKGLNQAQEVRAKMSASKQGELNNQFGKVWIMNRQLRQCKCVDDSTILEDGWEYGRCSDFEAEERKQKLKQEKILAKERDKNNRIQLLRNMYKFFVEHNNDFELMAKTFEYNHTRNSFMTRCKKYLLEYVPLPNNRWKNKH